MRPSRARRPDESSSSNSLASRPTGTVPARARERQSAAPADRPSPSAPSPPRLIKPEHDHRSAQPRRSGHAGSTPRSSRRPATSRGSTGRPLIPQATELLAAETSELGETVAAWAVGRSTHTTAEAACRSPLRYAGRLLCLSGGGATPPRWRGARCCSIPRVRRLPGMAGSHRQRASRREHPRTPRRASPPAPRTRPRR